MTSSALDSLADYLTQGKTEVDARRHRRRMVELSATYLLPDGVERSADVSDVSPGGVFLNGGNGAITGDTVAIRLDKLGHFNGEVTRITSEGFAVAFTHRREGAARLADKLIWLLNGGDKIDERRHADRFEQDRPCTITTPSGDVVDCVVEDISTRGARVALEADLDVGSPLILGHKPGRIVYKRNGKTGIEFATAEDTDA